MTTAESLRTPPLKINKECEGRFPLLVGITGPSGSGKTSLTSAICASGEWIVVNEDPETYKSGADPSPYSSRCPSTERPENVYWDVVQSQIDKAISSAVKVADSDDGAVKGVIIEHFLLPYLPRVSEQLDYLVVLDGTLNNSSSNCKNDTTDERMVKVLCERRVNRNPNRPDAEKTELRRYYHDAVWRQYRDFTRKSIVNLMEQMVLSSLTQAKGEEENEQRILTIDPIQNELDLIVKMVEYFLSTI